MSNFNSPTDRMLVRDYELKLSVKFLEVMMTEVVARVMNDKLTEFQRLHHKAFEEYASDLKKDMLESEKLKLEQISQQEKLLNINELATHFKVSKTTIHNWRKAKIIDGNKMGKGRFFSVREVESALRESGFKV